MIKILYTRQNSLVNNPTDSLFRTNEHTHLSQILLNQELEHSMATRFYNHTEK